MKKRTILAGLAAALALTSAGAGSASSAAVAPSKPVGCGATVTGLAHLDRDLRCPAGQGITLTGDAMLDLRGHALIGPGNDPGSGFGVSASVTGTSRVVNGSIRGWSIGIGSAEPDSSFVVSVHVSGVQLLENNVGISALGWGHVEVRGSQVGGGNVGIDTFESTLTVADSGIVKSVTGVRVADSTVTISRSRLLGHPRMAVDCFSGACAVDHSWIADSSVGVAGTSGSRPRLVANTFKGNTTGYDTGRDLFGSEVVAFAVDNQFVSNGVGIGLRSPVDITASRNTFSANGVGIGRIAPPDDESFGGILVGNTFTRNGDGVNVPSAAGVSLGGNRAVGNTGWGLFVPGATDLGGNTAGGNGNEPQCVGVTCTQPA